MLVYCVVSVSTVTGTLQLLFTAKIEDACTTSVLLEPHLRLALTRSMERFRLRFLWALLLVGVAALADCGCHAFVNVPHVRKAMLQSTSTSVTYEPSFIYADTFRRNPFAGDQEDEEEDPNSNEDASASISASAFDERLINARGSTAAVALPTSTLSSSLASAVSPKMDDAVQNPWIDWIGEMTQLVQSERSRRQAQTKLRTALFHFMRDSGTLRGVMDFLVTIGTPKLALDHPEIVPRFLQLTQQCRRIPYGDHALQGIDMFMPSKQAAEEPKGLLFFVVGSFLFVVEHTLFALITPADLYLMFFVAFFIKIARRGLGFWVTLDVSTFGAALFE